MDYNRVCERLRNCNDYKSMDEIITSQIRTKSVPLLYKRKEVSGDSVLYTPSYSSGSIDAFELGVLRNKFITIKVTR